MKEKFKKIFFLALATGLGIIAFQTYWVYNAYRTGKNEFTGTAKAALQRANDSYLLNLRLKSDHIHPIAFDGGPDTISWKPTSDNSRTKLNGVTGKGIEFKTSPEFVRQFNLAEAGFIAQTYAEPYNKDSLQAIYMVELNKAGISLPFSLLLFDTLPAQNNADTIFTPTNFTQGTVAIGVVFTGDRNYILSHVVVPFIVSLVLVLLTAGCLWYMWRIIHRQKQLDEIKDEFINNMTHELKTPIAVLKTTHDALYNFGAAADPEKIQRYLAFNIDELDKLEGKVDRILDITLYENGMRPFAPEKVNVKSLITEIARRFEMDDRNNINIHFHLPEEELVIDREALGAILSNLLDNAVKYSDKKYPVIDIIVDPVAGNRWRIEMRDNGPGIPARQQPFIFDKFYRGPTGNLHNVKGYGLGLSYVKELVTSLGGKINMKNGQGSGAVFTIEMPAS